MKWFVVALLCLTCKLTQAAELPKLDVSGYYQGRMIWNQEGSNSFNAGSFDTARARFKVVAKPTSKTSVTYQVDLAKGPVETKDMFVTYLVTPVWSVSFGQMTVPFGFEVTTGDLKRTTPERSLWSRTLFPGERDRGILFNGKLGQVKLGAGVFNGTQINKDSNRSKDISVRAVVPVTEGVKLGLSGWFGTDTVTLPWFTPNSRFQDRKLGADLVITDGVWSLKGEIVQARQTTNNPWGWDAQVACNITPRNMLVAKFDSFDGDNLEQFKNGRVNTWNFGAIHQLDKNVKLKVFYVRSREQFASSHNDMILTEVLANF